MSALGAAFSTLEEARAALDEMAKGQGWALAQRTRKLDPQGQVRYLILRCSKGREYRQNPTVASTHETKRRHRVSTQRTGCKVTVTLTFKKDTQKWVTAMPNGDEHNHALLPAQAHTKYRIEGLNALRDRIVSLYNAGVKPTSIATQLRGEAKPDEALAGISSQDVRNVLARHSMGGGASTTGT
ncbi:hypothetical protein JDV02_007342 [Purpureocillium takamizusanense]|uniref:FAR1 domain-containing protein n=1 Tax=Purpureocillium takamizusanense TaxID=2060973 RepID=A0A9Q8QMB2_9HYPO|nr:uncharacterized protein JDV02_007342 [Purpureocillium takamizusanense]UNI21344.1 hypothetical protein JDV02_007342 [Purpureocillium takamizusanense]